MIFKYDKERLLYSKLCIKTWVLYLLSILLLIAIVGFSIGRNTAKEVIIENLQQGETEIFIAEVDTFTQDKLVSMLSDLNVQYPHIVMAQSILETGHFKSDIFFENHNLFGMKQARRRITTAEGTNRNHAYYNHWRESVYDYAFYQCRYLSKLDSEEDYFKYLGASYAEASNYVSSLKHVIKKNDLEKIFK
tara:strand:+ start:2394 stop:2966 length:573 start_codon:yes stop_codon:yes gene_type:complete